MIAREDVVSICSSRAVTVYLQTNPSRIPQRQARVPSRRTPLPAANHQRETGRGRDTRRADCSWPVARGRRSSRRRTAGWHARAPAGPGRPLERLRLRPHLRAASCCGLDAATNATRGFQERSRDRRRPRRRDSALQRSRLQLNARRLRVLEDRHDPQSVSGTAALSITPASRRTDGFLMPVAADSYLAAERHRLPAGLGYTPAMPDRPVREPSREARELHEPASVANLFEPETRVMPHESLAASGVHRCRIPLGI